MQLMAKATMFAILISIFAIAFGGCGHEETWDQDATLPIQSLLEEEGGWIGMGSNELDQTIYYKDAYYHFEKGDQHLKVKCYPLKYKGKLNHLFNYLVYTPRGEDEREEFIFCEGLLPCRWQQHDFNVRFYLKPGTRAILENICSM